MSSRTPGAAAYNCAQTTDGARGGAGRGGEGAGRCAGQGAGEGGRATAAPAAPLSSQWTAARWLQAPPSAAPRIVTEFSEHPRPRARPRASRARPSPCARSSRWAGVRASASYALGYTCTHGHTHTHTHTHAHAGLWASECLQRSQVWRCQCREHNGFLPWHARAPQREAAIGLSAELTIRSHGAGRSDRAATQRAPNRSCEARSLALALPRGGAKSWVR